MEFDNQPQMKKSKIEETLKSADTEETIDIYFYRKLGYHVASFSARAGIRPNTITIISIFWGILAGHLYYYNNLTINILGIFALIVANTLDSADGQLARMTNDKTQLGRILDGLAGNFWFASIYIHLALRMQTAGMGNWVWMVGAFTGVCHVFQAAVADYYRNGHLFFIKGETGSEFHNSQHLKIQYESLQWKAHFWLKLFTLSYINYTREQELLTGNLQKLIESVRIKFGNKIPPAFTESFRSENRPLMKYTNILTFNTRAIALWVAVLVNIPILYWLFELTVLNLILIYMIIRQQKISKKFLALLPEFKPEK